MAPPVNQPLRGTGRAVLAFVATGSATHGFLIEDIVDATGISAWSVRKSVRLLAERGLVLTERRFLRMREDNTALHGVAVFPKPNAITKEMATWQ